MKNRTLILVVLIMAVLLIAGSYSTGKKAYAQDIPSIEDIVGTYVNEEMPREKVVIKSDGTFLHYIHITDPFPSDTNNIIIKDSRVDKNGNKYYKNYITVYVLERLTWHHFDLMRLNESGTVLEFNRKDSLEFNKSEYQDVPEVYPTEIDPNSLDFYYRIYYRQ